MRVGHDAELESVGVWYHDVFCDYGIGKISGPNKLAEISRHLSDRPSLGRDSFSVEPACFLPAVAFVLICKYPA